MSREGPDLRKSDPRRIPEIVRPSTVDASVFDGDLKLENAALRERLKDLDAQVQKLQASRLIAPHEEAANAEMATQWRALNAEKNEIAKFFRENYQREIERGEHAVGSFSSLVIRYLRRERAVGAVGRFIGRVFGGAA